MDEQRVSAGANLAKAINEAELIDAVTDVLPVLRRAKLGNAPDLDDEVISDEVCKFWVGILARADIEICDLREAVERYVMGNQWWPTLDRIIEIAQVIRGERHTRMSLESQMARRDEPKGTPTKEQRDALRAKLFKSPVEERLIRRRMERERGPSGSLSTLESSFRTPKQIAEEAEGGES